MRLHAQFRLLTTAASYSPEDVVCAIGFLPVLIMASWVSGGQFVHIFSLIVSKPPGLSALQSIIFRCHIKTSHYNIKI